MKAFFIATLVATLSFNDEYVISAIKLTFIPDYAIRKFQSKQTYYKI